MKFNNKGYMLIEIILASAIAFGLMYFIVDLTINLKNKNDDLLVKTSLTTDQSILSNEIISHILEKSLDDKTFEPKDFCNKINIVGNTVKYGDEVITEVSEYGNITGYECTPGETYINIKIPIEVKQLKQKGENFDIDVYYEFTKRKFVSSIGFTYRCLEKDFEIGKTFFDNPSNRVFGDDELFIYTGKCDFERDSVSNDWKVSFLTSGYLLFRETIKTDIFLVGGGGGGSRYHQGEYGSTKSHISGGGGGGGYTTTKRNITVKEGDVYEIIIGAGGAGGDNTAGEKGGTTIAFDITADGGNGGSKGSIWNDGYSSGGGGGAGGSGGGDYAKHGGLKGGSNGSDGDGGSNGDGGKGQGTTTAEFGEEGRKLYAGGGAGGRSCLDWYAKNAGPSEGGGGGTNESGIENTGGGGGGGATCGKAAGDGGSGIVVMRNVINDNVDGVTFSKLRNNYKCNYNGTDSTNGLYFTYTGYCKLINDVGNSWKLTFTSNGELKLYQDIDIDAFLVGGGGGGAGNNSGAGGHGGESVTNLDITLTKDNTYNVVIGEGGTGGSAAGKGKNGNNTTAFGITAHGGIGGGNANDLYGSAGGKASTYTNCKPANGKSYGIGGQYKGGNTQTTCEFNEAIFGSDNSVTGCIGLAYGAGGGAKCIDDSPSTSHCGNGNCGSKGGVYGGGDGGGGTDGTHHWGFAAIPNTGGGGGGGTRSKGNEGSGGNGGKGVVIIRNTRTN